MPTQLGSAAFFILTGFTRALAGNLAAVTFRAYCPRTGGALALNLTFNPPAARKEKGRNRCKHARSPPATLWHIAGIIRSDCRVAIAVNRHHQLLSRPQPSPPAQP